MFSTYSTGHATYVCVCAVSDTIYENFTKTKILVLYLLEIFTVHNFR